MLSKVNAPSLELFKGFTSSILKLQCPPMVIISSGQQSSQIYLLKRCDHYGSFPRKLIN
jgi:hypothetical protein